MRNWVSAQKTRSTFGTVLKSDEVEELVRCRSLSARAKGMLVANLLHVFNLWYRCS